MKINKEKIGSFLADSFTRSSIGVFIALIVNMIFVIFIKNSFVRIFLFYVTYFLVLRIVNKIYVKIGENGK